MNPKNGIEEMKVQDSLICAKMTEESSKNGVSEIASGKPIKTSSPLNEEGTSGANGALSPNSALSTDTTDPNRTSGGGRLKFFKDGKFILELSHSNQKDGERTSWVPVPKKTFWPPHGAGTLLSAVPAAGTSRQESSASLSVSDDNSSVQSSPWQRDHCWKQQTPQRGLGQELTFLMKAKPLARWARHKAASVVHKKQRRPLDSSEVLLDLKEAVPVVFPQNKIMKRCKKKLSTIVDKLRDTAVEVSSKTNSAKLDPTLVSPRKRILREFERVTLEDHASKRHKRPSAFLKSPSPPSVASCSSNMSAVKTKGSFNVPSSTPSPPSHGCNSHSAVHSSLGKSKVEKLGSYSISSLLGKSDSDPTIPSEPSFLRSLLKSPSRTAGDGALSAASSSPSSSLVHSPQPSQSPPETRWSSRPHKKKLPSPDATLRLAPPSQQQSNPPILPPPSHHLSPPNFLSHPHLYPNLPYLPPHHPPMMPAHYFTQHFPLAAPPRGLWQHPAAAAAAVAAAGLHYPGLLPLPWSQSGLGPPTSPPQSILVEPNKREELAADMPLNLSKHAG